MPDNTHSTLLPAEIVFDPTGEPVDKAGVPDAPITDAEADAAATAMGMTFFKSATARNLRKIGAFTAQQGVINLGVGRLAAADEAIQKLLNTAVDIAEDDDQDTKDRVGALVAGKALVEVLQNSIELMAKFQTEKLISGPLTNRRRSFVDESPIVPIQANTVNINVDSGSSS